MSAPRLALCLAAGVLVAACSGGSPDEGDVAAPTSDVVAAATPTPTQAPADSSAAATAPAPSAEPASVETAPPSPRPAPAAPEASPRPAPPPATPAARPRPSPAQSPAARPSPRPAPAPADRVLTIEGFAFSPRTMTVDLGTRVTATNKDEAVHTWTADDGEWDSGSLAQGESYSFTFRAAGTYSFFCKPHPFMTGSITVG